MRTKQKLIICFIFFMVGAVINIFFSMTVHGILSGQIGSLKLFTINECLRSIFMIRQHLILFLCFQGFILLMAVIYFLTNLRPYQSDLVEITPDIKTPIPVGQYQHGSARWLNETEKEKAFDSFILDPNHPQVMELIESGYEDLEFTKKRGLSDYINSIKQRT